MQFQTKTIDRFQIVGFIISTAVSLVLALFTKEALTSVTVGLILATLTQLFDLQIRQSASEKRILNASRLNQKLYQDAWLLEHVAGIVDDYFTVKNTWFKLFRINANDALVDCRRVLHGMADQRYTVTDLKNPLKTGLMAFEQAQKSIKITVVGFSRYWKEGYFDKRYIRANKDAVERGVSVTRIFLQKRESLSDMIALFKKLNAIGVDIRVGFMDEGKIPAHLINDTLIIDDRAFSQPEFDIDGNPRRVRISIDSAETQRKVKDFETLFYYTQNLEDAIKDPS